MTAPSPRPDVLAVLAVLDALQAAATPRPWAQQNEAPTLVYGDPSIGVFVCSTAPGVLDPHPDSVLIADAALIVAAVNALPQLTAVVRAVHALAEELDADQERAYQRSVKGPRIDEFSDGQHHAYEDAADRLRAVLAALAPDTTTEKASKA